MNTLITALLIVTIIILVYYILTDGEMPLVYQAWDTIKKGHDKVTEEEMYGVSMRKQNEPYGVSGGKKNESYAAVMQNYENMCCGAMKENAEFFQSCGDNHAQKIVDCVCNGTEGSGELGDFGTWAYGGPNMDYKEYVASQAVDNKVIENHLMFVRDRRGLGPEGEFITGRTYSPDSHDSYNPIPWVGIRGRGDAVPQCNPTQVPDIDTNLYKKNRPYCLWT